MLRCLCIVRSSIRKSQTITEHTLFSPRGTITTYLDERRFENGNSNASCCGIAIQWQSQRILAEKCKSRNERVEMKYTNERKSI